MIYSRNWPGFPGRTLLRQKSVDLQVVPGDDGEGYEYGKGSDWHNELQIPGQSENIIMLNESGKLGGIKRSKNAS